MPQSWYQKKKNGQIIGENFGVNFVAQLFTIATV